MSFVHAEHAASENYRRRQPETFARYLSRRKCVFAVAYAGYVCAYLVRNNFKLTSEALRLANGWSLTQVGLILTAFTVTYGVGKFVMGMVVDRTSLRKTFALALGLSAVVCIAVGFTTSLPVLFAAMLFLGLIQGALAPASMAMIANWYPNTSRGAGIAIWNTSQNLGGAGLPLIITGLLGWTGPDNLASAFWVPGVVVLALSFLFWRIGGDRPDVEGLDTLDTMFGEAGSPRVRGEPATSYWALVRRDVFTSRVILTLAAINAMLYFLRFGILNWMPAFLGTEMGFTRAQYSMAFSSLEWIAVPGSFLFAWLSVALPNRQSLVGCLGLGALAGLIVFYMGNRNYPLLLVSAGLMGMLVYGPQLIVNVLTLNLVPLRAAGVAVGFVGLGGYLVGELCANLVMPLLAQRFNWTVSLTFLAGIALAAGLLYLSLRSSERSTVRVVD
ncbi:MAG: MFS transporter [Opitutaceae bacterium]|nr:MFS transporter [Opitutaceae bacterium]